MTRWYSTVEHNSVTYQVVAQTRCTAADIPIASNIHKMTAKELKFHLATVMNSTFWE